MTYHATKIKDLLQLSSEPIGDERGWFMRLFDADELNDQHVSFPIKQASLSFTKEKHMLRGLHFQKQPKEEQKIVRCIQGSIYDVVLDLRLDSPSYLQSVAMELSGANHHAFLIPKGCAHGFLTLSENCFVQYTMSESYDAKLSSGVRWNDPAFSIHWPVEHPTMNERDATWPLYSI